MLLKMPPGIPEVTQQGMVKMDYFSEAHRKHQHRTQVLRGTAFWLSAERNITSLDIPDNLKVSNRRLTDTDSFVFI